MTSTDRRNTDEARRFSDIGTLPKRMLAPIEGYEHVPLVSLEEAVEPLVGIVPKIKRNVFIIMQNFNALEDDLSTDESAAIMLYTLESMPHENSLYVILNATLRSEQRQKLAPWFLYLRLLLTALAHLPSERHFVVRGVKKDLRAEYPKGSTFIWWGFSSCTSSVEVLECENFFGRSGTRTLFQIDCDTGKNIKKQSFLQHEDEVLLLPGRQFRVTSCLDSGNDLHIIQLKEIQPAFPLLEPVPLASPMIKLRNSSSMEARTKTEQPYRPTSVSLDMASSKEPITQDRNATDQQVAVPYPNPKVTCKGHFCTNCGKCRDWRYTGHPDDWEWIRQYRTWDSAAIQRIRDSNYHRNFELRVGATCDRSARYFFGTMLVFLSAGHFKASQFLGHVCTCN